MNYKFLGSEMKAGCTPAPSTPYDNRSCRERTGCTRECNPKTLKCEHCGKMFSMLNILENTDTNERVSICNNCEMELRRNEY